MRTLTRLAVFLSVLFLLVPRSGSAAGSRPATGTTGVAPRDSSAGPAEVVGSDEGSGGEPEERQFERDYFRALAGGEMDSARIARMWSESRAMPSEPPPQVTTPPRTGAPARAEVVNGWQLAGPIFSTNVGGGFMTGRVRDLDPIHVRALAASGGLWRFDIFGGIPMCDSVPASWFGSFATHPLDANTILLATGEYHGGAGTGIYRTTDAGATWTHAQMAPQPYSFSRVRWSSDGTVAVASSTAGIYRSTDGGLSWVRTYSGGDTGGLTSVPGDPGEWFAAVNSTGVLRSQDNGATWQPLSGSGAPVGVTGIGAISAMYNSGDGHVYVYVAFDTSIWKSADNGATWTNVTPTGFGIGNSGYGPAISVCPGNPNIVLYGDVPIVRTTDGGAHWNKFATPDLHADYHVFGWDADNAGVWAGNDGGWSHSLDQGATWSSSSNAMPITQFYTVDCEKTEVGTMIGGTQDNNVLYTLSPSLNWTDPQVGSTEGDAYGVTVDLYNPSQMWAVSGVLGGPITYARYHTTDGTTWNTVDNGIAPTTWAGSMCTDNAYPADIFTSTDHYVYESTDAGATWDVSNAAPFASNIGWLTASTRVAGGAVLYAALASSGGDRLEVRDNGAWSERSTGLPVGQRVFKVIPHPWASNANEAWAIMSGVGHQIWYTTNRGVTWTDVTGDFPPSVPVSSFVPNPRHTGEWYAGSSLGCWRTKNGGVNWEHWNNGMPPAAIVTDMKYIDQTGSGGPFSVVAATYGRSVWKRDVSGEDPFPTISVSDPVVQEGDNGQNTAFFLLTLSQAQTDPSNLASASWATADSTATAADNDYVPQSGVAYFPAGATQAYATVPIVGDRNVESDEVFKLVLSNPLRASLGDPGVCTIQDDDSRGLVCGDLDATDGTVNAMVRSGNTIYVGGSFQHVGPATGGAVPIDATTGLPASLPRVTGSVGAVASDGAGGWYLGGTFSHVGGQPRTNLAHVLADGTLDPWNPVTNGAVQAIAISGNTLYIGGSFTGVGGVPRTYLASIMVGNSLPTDWNPSPDAPVYAMAVDGNTLYLGGYFTQLLGVPRDRAAAVKIPDDTLTAWNPSPDAEVDALLADGGLVYAGGTFTQIGGQPRAGLAALDPSSGAATPWNPSPDGSVFALAGGAGGIYAGGLFSNVGGQARTNLAALDRASGLATDWTPNPDGAVDAIATDGGIVYAGGSFANAGGSARSGLVALDPTTGLATSWDPAPNGGVAALAAGNGTVLAGGSFTLLAPQPRERLAAFDATSGQLLPWNPGTDGTVYALAAGGGVVYAGGTFANAGGQPRSRIAAIDSVTALATAWAPNADGTVRTLLLDGSVLFAGGQFANIGGQARSRLAGLSVSTGNATSFNPNANNTVYALATDGTLLYAGGLFTNIGGQPFGGLAALSPKNGAALPTWNPSPSGPVDALELYGTLLFVGGQFTTIAGLARPNLALIDLSSATVAPWAPAPNGVVTCIAPVSSNQVYVGGTFTLIGGQPRNHVAYLRASTNSVSSWAPQPSGTVNALLLEGSTLWMGGSFSSLGGLPQARLGCAIPLTDVGVPGPTAPAAFSLSLAPNPTSGRVRLDYVLPVATRVSFAVYDVQGRRVGPAFAAVQAAGAHQATWELPSGGPGAPAGVYFLRFQQGGRETVRRLVVLR